MTHEATVMDLFLADWEKVKANPTPGNLRNFGAVLALFVQEYNRMDEVTADRDRLAAEVARLKRSGAPLANIAFNLAQKEGQTLDAHTCKLMDGARKDWDDAQIAAAGKDGRG